MKNLKRVLIIAAAVMTLTGAFGANAFAAAKKINRAIAQPTVKVQYTAPVTKSAAPSYNYSYSTGGAIR